MEKTKETIVMQLKSAKALEPEQIGGPDDSVLAHTVYMTKEEIEYLLKLLEISN